MKNKDFFDRLAQGIATQFGENCEVAIHDLTQKMDSTIVTIVNGHVSGRKVGDGASDAVIHAIQDKNSQDEYNYLTRTADGRILRSSTIYIREEDGTIIGLLSINCDTTDLIMARNTIEKLVTTEVSPDKAVKLPMPNVNDMLDEMIEESQKRIGKPVAMMNKNDKVRAIQYLNSRGALLIKKSGDRIAKYYDISKYSLYSYLDADIDE